jgi:N-acylglucosamine-6-phosphate 2-epimerase
MVVLELGDNQFFQKIKGKLIVSCQALENEPLHGSEVMAKMAAGAEMGGAAGIRANGAGDIAAIKKKVSLPVIGLVKRDYPDSEVYITPTLKEIDELIEAGADMIAMDATIRKRPNSESLENLVRYAKKNNKLTMADISTYEEGIQAAKLGFDCVSTTMSGYTSHSVNQTGPDFLLIEKLAKILEIPVIGEGRISTPAEAQTAIQSGAYAVVVGSAITRPQIITQKYADAISKEVNHDVRTKYSI